jgi:hypothetical protein
MVGGAVVVFTHNPTVGGVTQLILCSPSETILKTLLVCLHGFVHSECAQTVSTDFEYLFMRHILVRFLSFRHFLTSTLPATDRFRV